MVESLVKLGKKLDAGPPVGVVEAAVAANPWFTPYYLCEAVAGVRSWLTEAALAHFLSGYPPLTEEPKRIGIIAAGNLPLVGWHDVLVALLSGHHAYVKYASRDQVMMDWVRQCWQEIWPALAGFFHPVSRLSGVDWVLATGSDNSARYFRQAFPDTPKLIRQHRYSVAVLDQSTSDEDLIRLNRDMLLYNGLGCRNVSSLLLSPGFDEKRLQESLDTYTADWVNPRYLERVLYIDQMYQVLGKPAIRTSYALLQATTEPLDLGMGILSVIRLNPEERTLADWRKQHEAHWQCVVGPSVPFGNAQRPGLADFADGVDTMQWLCTLSA
jgi:hypothetical protein